MSPVILILPFSPASMRSICPAATSSNTDAGSSKMNSKSLRGGWRVGLPILETFAVREQHHEVAQLADREIERARIADDLRQHVEGATRGIFIDFRIFVEELFDRLVPFGRVNRRHDNPLAADPVRLIEPIFPLPQLGQAIILCNDLVCVVAAGRADSSAARGRAAHVESFHLAADRCASAAARDSCGRAGRARNRPRASRSAAPCRARRKACRRLRSRASCWGRRCSKAPGISRCSRAGRRPIPPG